MKKNAMRFAAFAAGTATIWHLCPESHHEPSGVVEHPIHANHSPSGYPAVPYLASGQVNIGSTALGSHYFRASFDPEEDVVLRVKPIKVELF